MKNLLNEEIKSEFKALSEMDKGTGDYTAVVKGLHTLMQTALELEKMEAENNKQNYLREQDRLKLEKEEKERQDRLELQAKEEEQEEKERQDRLELQAKQLEFQEGQLELQRTQVKLQEKQSNQNAKHNTVQILTVIGTTLLTAAITVWGTYTTLEFEKEGTVTTSAGRNFFGKLFSKS